MCLGVEGDDMADAGQTALGAIPAADPQIQAYGMGAVQFVHGQGVFTVGGGGHHFGIHITCIPADEVAGGGVVIDNQKVDGFDSHIFLNVAVGYCLLLVWLWYLFSGCLKTGRCALKTCAS